MFVLKIFITFGVIISITNVVSAQIQYEKVFDRTGPRDRIKLVWLCQELVAEAQYKIHQTDHIRDTMSTRLGFQIGMIIGQIREKYRTMLEVYRQTSNKFTKKSKIIMPEDPERRPIHYLWRMEYVSALEMDIERLVHILETIPLELVEDYHDATEKPKGLRMGGRSQEFEALLARKEEEVKRGYRQQFLMEKLGLPFNTSTPA